MSRSLQARLAFFYAVGVYVAGVVVLAVLTLSLIEFGSTVPGPGEAPRAGAVAPRLLPGSVVALAVLVPVALAAGWFVAGRFLRPLRAITATAAAISAGNLHQRLDLGGAADELTELGSILDDLFARLEASFAAQRHFVAHASHELRTPLAGLRTLLEVALADPDADADDLRTVCREALALGAHQERLVQALLTLATSERGLTRRDTLDLAQVAAGVVADRRDQATRGGLDLAEHLAPAVTTGDPGLVASLVANLVDNAVQHNHRDGHVEVTTRTAGGRAVLVVTNSGPVVPGDQVQRLLKPFEKLARDRHDRGYGLGLAIVDAVARAHHATLTTAARPGGGLTVTVEFG